ncbi:hypothetical protein LXL04_030773 [Taraxacum kok-saghyz]
MLAPTVAFLLPGFSLPRSDRRDPHPVLTPPERRSIPYPSHQRCVFAYLAIFSDLNGDSKVCTSRIGPPTPASSRFNLQSQEIKDVIQRPYIQQEHRIIYGEELTERLASEIKGKLEFMAVGQNYPCCLGFEVFLVLVGDLLKFCSVEVTTKSISPSMMKVFQRGLLSQKDNDGSRLTESGFQFLLMDTNAQLWYIIREYISNSEDRGVVSADLISFMLELSFWRGIYAVVNDCQECLS